MDRVKLFDTIEGFLYNDYGYNSCKAIFMDLSKNPDPMDFYVDDIIYKMPVKLILINEVNTTLDAILINRVGIKVPCIIESSTLNNDLIPLIDPEKGGYIGLFTREFKYLIPRFQLIMQNKIISLNKELHDLQSRLKYLYEHDDLPPMVINNNKFKS